MNYRKVYMQIISAAKNQQKLGLRPQKVSYKKEDFQNKYFEFHHILPRSLFPNWIKRESNVVPLTAREHFSAISYLQRFILLVKCFMPFGECAAVKDWEIEKLHLENGLG